MMVFAHRLVGCVFRSFALRQGTGCRSGSTRWTSIQSLANLDHRPYADSSLSFSSSVQVLVRKLCHDNIA